jgi:N-acetylmuramoyl-L-alanine amidase
MSATRQPTSTTRTASPYGVRLLLVLVLLAPCLLGARRPPGLGDVRDLRFWSHPDYTRVVVELTRAVDAEVVRLPADPKAGQPERLYVDLEGIWVGRSYVSGVPVGDGLLRTLRLGQNTLHKSRLVIDLQGYQNHRLIVLGSPHRVVVDVYGERSQPEEYRWPRPPESQRRDANSRLSMSLRGVRKVVIDPGHGGKDPGTVSRSGVREKDVNLRLALILAEQLKDRGFEVLLTRDDDRYLNLEERTVLAESARGDVFISLHANASPNRRTRGIEIYYLDQNHERHSMDVAARENEVSRQDMDSLQRTLARLRTHEASDHSRRLAHLVHGEVIPGLGRKYKSVPDLGVKTGPFYVLFLSSMPSILLESGFLSNRRDAVLLQNSQYLETLAEHMAKGLVSYRKSERKLAGGAAE